MSFPSFLHQVLRGPRTVGAIAPSSPALCAAMVREALPAAGQVIELGPGQGPVTAALLAAGLPPSQLVAVEINPGFAGDLARRHPDINVWAEDARRLPQLLAQHGRPAQAEVVVSSLPWLAFPETMTLELLDAIDHVLAPVGRLVQFTYGWRQPLPAAWLAQRSWTVRFAHQVWRNLPPARVYVYQRAAVSP